MSNGADTSLSVLIQFIADTTGAKVSEAEAQKLLDKMTELNAVSEEMNTHLPEGAALWSKYKNVLQETTGEAQKLGFGHHQLFYVMEQMGVRLPGLGFLLRGLITPATVATLGLVGAWEIYNARMKEAAEIASDLELPDLSKIEPQLTAGAEAARKYAEALNAVTEAYSSIDAASERRLKKLKDELELQKQLVTAQKEAALAALEQNKKNLTPEEYAQQRALIEGRAGAQTSALEAGEAQAEIEEKTKRRHELLANAAAHREAAARITVPTAAEDERNLSDAKTAYDKAMEQREKAQSNIADIGDAKSGFNPYYLLRHFYRYGFDSGSSAEAQEQGKVDRANGDIKRYEALLAGKQAREDARKERERLAQLAGKEQGEANVLDESIPEDQRSTDQRSAANQTVTNLKALSGLGVIGNPDAVRQIVENHKQNQQQFSLLLNSMGWAPQIVALMQQQTALNQNLMAEVQAMNARIAQLASSMPRVSTTGQ